MKLVHFSDAHVQLPGWRERPLDELGPLRALASVELWKGRGKLFDDAMTFYRASSEGQRDQALAVLARQIHISKESFQAVLRTRLRGDASERSR